MTLTLKKHGSVIISLITAVAIITSALLFKDTKYEEAWIYVLVSGFLANAVYEIFSIRSKCNVDIREDGRK